MSPRSGRSGRGRGLKPVLEALHRIVLQALQSPDVKEKFGKQKMDIAPQKSLAEAKTWLDDEIKHWQTITSAVKIELSQ